MGIVLRNTGLKYPHTTTASPVVVHDPQEAVAGLVKALL